MFDGNPKDVQAIVVAVDDYAEGDAWNLTGPTRDALHTVDWLCERDVPEQNITLFLSPSTWVTHEVQTWLASRPSLVTKNAISHEFAKYINEDLQGVTAKALLLHWGGHGVVGDQADKQYLYTADATKDAPYCVCAQKLVNVFRTSRYRNIKQQVFIFDVCANQERIALGDAKPLAVGLIETRKLEATTSQCQMYGASLGNRAANETGAGREGGLFSQSLFDVLKDAASPGMQEFVDAFIAIREDDRLQELRRQKPMIVAPGNYVSRPPADQLTGEEHWLLARIAEIDPPHARLKRLYLQSQPHVELRPISADLEQWMRDLKDTRPRVAEGYPSPLVEFAERLGRELNVADLQEWARRQCKPGQYSTLETSLDGEQQLQKKETANLFIEVRTEDAQEFGWWLEGVGLEATNTQSVAIESDGLHSTLARTLPDILSHAAGLVQSKFDLRVGFILPVGLLLSGLESIIVQPLEEDDPPAALNEQYPVLFHWSVRHAGKPTPSVNSWRSLVDVLEQRVDRGDGAGVIWLEQDPNDRTRYVRAYDALRRGAGTAISLGIEQVPGDNPSVQLETVKLCLKRGIPCLFWLLKPGADDEALHFRENIGSTFERYVPRNIPLSLLRDQRGVKLDQQLGVNHLLWDLPSHLPANNPNQYLLEDHP